MENRQEKSKLNLSMLTDFYEFTMANGYFEQGRADLISYFDLFFRRVPDGGGYVIMAGVEQVMDYLGDLKFDDEDIAYLRGKGIFSEGFLNYLRDFRFECDVWAIPEGTPVFPYEPILKVRGPIIQAQLIETMLLLTVNHQCLIATKSNRICRAAEGRPISEFGARRAQGAYGALMGARAAYIGGCASSSCTMADRDFKIPASGTMAHSWIQSFDSEYEAFEAYARLYPERSVFLVDTYNVIKSGVPNAIRVSLEYLIPKGCRPVAIRIDSGDLTYLSKVARRMLDKAGLHDCKILVSNSLDEYIIRGLISQGARIDAFGVGEKLITSQSEPVFGGVYKLAGIGRPDGSVEPKLKQSENVEKITTPCDKNVVRFYNKADDKAIADVLTLHDEVIDESKPYTLFDPENTWKRKTVGNYYTKQLLTPIIIRGERVYTPPPIDMIRDYCRVQVERLWEEVLRFENPQKYYVDLSQKLWDLKYGILHDLAESQSRGLPEK